MGRSPCCDKEGLKRGPWSPDEDELLVNYIRKNGHSSWRTLPKNAGLLRCGKSCRLRWSNYLRPDINRGPFTLEEEKTIIQLHGILGNRWAAIASQLQGRTDNEVKNFWNTHLKKRLLCMGLDPHTHAPLSPAYIPTPKSSTSLSRHMAQWETTRLEAEARLSKESNILGSSQSDLPSPGKPNTDYFLKIWDSEVGESFRKFHGKETTICQSPYFVKLEENTACDQHEEIDCKSYRFHGKEGTICQSPYSDKLEEKTACDQHEEIDCRSCRSDADVMAGSDSSSCNDLDDSSSLQLLLDYPGYEDEMNFFQGQMGNFSLFPNVLTENSLNFSL